MSLKMYFYNVHYEPHQTQRGGYKNMFSSLPLLLCFGKIPLFLVMGGGMSLRYVNLARFTESYKREGHKTVFSKEMRPETGENVEQFYSLAVYWWLAFEIW